MARVKYTTGIAKQFSPDLFQDNDEQARGAVLRTLTAQGIYAVNNIDRYGPDLVVYHGLRPGSYVECEVKRVWPADAVEFPWPEINLPERKGRYLQLRLGIEYWVIRGDLLRAVVIPGEAVRAADLVEVSNKYVRSGELFYKVPITSCRLVDLVERVGQ